MGGKNTLAFSDALKNNAMKMKDQFGQAAQSGDKKRAMAMGFGAFPMMLGGAIRQFGEERGASGKKWDRFVAESDRVNKFLGGLGG